MNRILKYSLASVIIVGFWTILLAGKSSAINFSEISLYIPEDTTATGDSLSTDTLGPLPFPFEDESTYPVDNAEQNPALFLNRPSNIISTVEYDDEANEYVFSQKIGTLNYRYPSSMTMEEYQEYEQRIAINEYFRERAKSESLGHQSGLLPKLHIGGDVFDKIFGSNTINIQPQGSAELIFGININKNDNPMLPERQRRTTTFDFDEKIQMNVTGQIGDKMNIQTNYNTESTFDFENKMNLAYEGKEDEIIQKIEAGDVTLPLSGSLITGSQSLFGLKTELQFGKLRVTTVFSQQKGEASVIEVEGGAQLSDFEVYADEYEANKHFFLSQYFKDRYDIALSILPIIQSAVNINKIEIWVTNKSGNFQESRNIVGFLDLGEANSSGEGINEDGTNVFNNSFISLNSYQDYFPDNEVNDLYEKMTTDFSDVRDINNVSTLLGPLAYQYDFTGGQDYEKIENARKLSTSEYTFHPQLGYISLNSALNADEVLAVAYEYTASGQIFQVGEFSSEVSLDSSSSTPALFLKLLKGTYLSPTILVANKRKINPTWELVMKNIYAIGAYQVNQQDFQLHVMYQDDKTGTAVNYLSEGQQPPSGINGEILLNVLNLDNLNSNNDPQPDGVFDFVNGITINTSNGRIIFPVREPFGSHLRKQINDDAIADKYVFEELYDSTQSVARQIAEKNKFYLEGTYQSASSSEITLNALNVPQGSVKVTSGGMQLTEGQDYTVDYTMGRVKIINEGLLQSGTPIKISLESNSLFNIQSKTLVGTHLDYRVSNDFNLGATMLNLTERPLTSKVNIGDEPISNTIWGVDGTYRTDVPFITKAIDFLPLLETKEKSTVSVTGEFAHLIPGHSKALSKSGVSYIDDFEGSQTAIDIRTWAAWGLASTPQLQDDMFPEASLTDNLAYGYNRAKLGWYNIDPLFLRDEGVTPNHISNDDRSSHYVREIYEEEIFPNKENANGIPTSIAILNLAYYPEERGPYNYDVEPNEYSHGVSADGKLNEPDTRWAGIMRKITTNDFESANVEFIEFWMMDPFVEKADSNFVGGDLYFNLGNVSEDVLKDSRKSFENGLPTFDIQTAEDAELAYVDTTNWGRVPLVQSLVNAFDNDLQARQFQDVGLDGLRDEDETDFFADYIQSLAQVVDSNQNYSFFEDPSSDNYHYFRGTDYDNQEVGILDRYKKYNGLDGNSPTDDQSPEDYFTSGTITPDVEDINGDNTLSEAESYYQYRIPITRQNLQYDKKYITDEIEHTETLKNGQKSKVTWYQFKIPIYEPEQVIGSISDFKSIRFIRMFLKNFDQDIILRFATLDLVRGEWRKYNLSLKEGGENLMHPQPTDASFDVSAINIEENGSKTPVNYILPPGIDRVIDPTNPQLRQLNEQSIVLKVLDLADGDARAAYKNVTMDVRQYKRLQLEVHAEEINNYPLNDKELYVFIRLGSDYKQNYYEYEVPLVLTPPGNYDNDEYEDRLIVWPDENRIDLRFSLFQDVKQERNDKMRESNSTVQLTTPYYIMDGENKVTVTGNPNLSNVRTIMLGIRNPNDADNDDPHSGEIWLNELRLSEFDETGGWAANARVMTKLADLGTVTVAGSTSKPGFGSIEKKVSERQKEEMLQYDISSNLELGKFFPQKAGIRIPVYLGLSESVTNPQYNPLDPDIPLSAAINNAKTQEERDSIKHYSQDYTKRKSVNFTNVKVTKGGQSKPKVYDLSNWSLTYSYNELFSRNVNTEFSLRKDYHGAISYNYNTRPKNIQPFKKSKSKFLKSSAMRLIKDFNFYYLPQQMSFRTNLDRMYQETKLRNINSPNIIIPTTFQKDFSWNRMYDLKYDLSRTFKLDFSATNIARIDEPEGKIDKDDDDYEWKRDSIVQNLYDFGRTTNYRHSINANWNVPINKIPILNFMSANARYNATYDWTTGPIMPDSLNIDLGNTIKNSNTLQVTPQINFQNLYNKVKYLKEINKKYRKGKSRNNKTTKQKEKETELVVYEKKNVTFKSNVAKSFTHNLQTEDVEVRAYDAKGINIAGQQKVVSENRVTFKVMKDYENARVEIKGRKEVKPNILKLIVENTVNVMMGVRNVSVSYSQNSGTLLPGYNPKTKFFGNESFNGKLAPGVGFILGQQDKDLAFTAQDNGWITADSTLNATFAMTNSQTITLRSSVEPVANMRIDITANRTFSENVNYLFNPTIGKYAYENQMVNGNFTMSVNTWGTAFQNSGDDYSTSAAFDDFKNYRITIAKRLAYDRADVDDSYDPSLTENGFPDGYGPTSQQVMIPAFLAAYTGQSPERISLDPFPSVLSLRPNWRINYDGLSRIEFLKKYFNTITVGHTYRSSYNIGSYSRNIDYVAEAGIDGLSFVRDQLQNNFIAENEINSVSINEQFSPLINFDMTWINSLTSKVEIKKTRNLTMSFSNNQLTEVKNNEIIIGGGYRIKDLTFRMGTLGGPKKEYKSDLTLRADLSIRTARTVLRKLVEDVDQLTSGQRVISIETTADYVLSDRFNVRFFINYSNTKPFVSLTYPQTNTKVGFSVRFTLAG